jgi:hypothetical protein
VQWVKLSLCLKGVPDAVLDIYVVWAHDLPCCVLSSLYEQPDRHVIMRSGAAAMELA